MLRHQDRESVPYSAQRWRSNARHDPEWQAGRVVRNAWEKLPEAQRPKTYIFGVGDDANLPLLRLLARQDGVLEQVLSTEPMDFKLTSFLSKIGRSPIGRLRLEVSPEAAVDSVYPLQDSAFSGSLAAWVGRYQKPRQEVAFTVRGARDGSRWK